MHSVMEAKWFSKGLTVFVSAFALAGAPGCTHDGATSVPDTAVTDDAYFQVYSAETRSQEFVSNFETRFIVHATRLSEAFVSALDARHQRIYGETGSSIIDASSKTGFFISLFAGEDEALDLRDGKIWSVAMNQSAAPSFIRDITDKARWPHFFPNSSPWSHEYLVVFDTESPADQVELSLRHADGSIAFSWGAKE